MNETSQNPFWNWKGWQTFKWITGGVVLFGVLVMIWNYNTKGEDWIEDTVKNIYINQYSK